MTLAEAKRRVRIAKYNGDDAYSYALFIDGRVTYAGMDRNEVRWRRKRAQENLVAGRRWDA